MASKALMRISTVIFLITISRCLTTSAWARQPLEPIWLTARPVQPQALVSLLLPITPPRVASAVASETRPTPRQCSARLASVTIIKVSPSNFPCGGFTVRVVCVCCYTLHCSICYKCMYVCVYRSAADPDDCRSRSSRTLPASDGPAGAERVISSSSRQQCASAWRGSDQGHCGPDYSVCHRQQGQPWRCSHPRGRYVHPQSH